MIWAGMGTIPGINSIQLELWAIHTSMIQALEKKHYQTHFEMDNSEVFETIRDQNENIYDDETEKVLRQINTIHNKNFKMGVIARRFSFTLPYINQTAIFLVTKGLEHADSFMEGFTHIVVVMPFLGNGEVSRGSPPHSQSSVVKSISSDDSVSSDDYVSYMSEDTKETQYETHPGHATFVNVTLNLNVTSEGWGKGDDPLTSFDFQYFWKKLKGKEKVLSECVFNEDGL
ncbi:hypothetical protein POM88_023845 [Heracleum sosnowskyi]|uniref:Uncharacterized protein n=1 Tax=Heracleum sosnowskyi TaxID=360622 RepID=A0AAD8ILH6_9APIA|nr:hypothetical protein POM88_023845 [Heracleum sosnowskyi]